MSVPIYAIGDIHGQYHDMVHFFNKILDKVSQAKSAVKSLKGTAAKLSGKGYDLKNINAGSLGAVADQLAQQAEAAQATLDKRRSSLEKNKASKQAKQQATLSQLKSKHPDMESILQDAKFAEWIKGSKVRTQLFVQADQSYDYDAAHELFSLWKERSQVVQQTANVEKQARKQQIKAANTGNARGSAEGSRKKVYRRADIIKLMRTDPERYQALSEEILRAYSEGRVK